MLIYDRKTYEELRDVVLSIELFLKKSLTSLCTYVIVSIRSLGD